MESRDEGMAWLRIPGDTSSSSSSLESLNQSLESSAPIIGLLLSSSLVECVGWQTMNVAENSKWIFLYKLFISRNRSGGGL